MQEKSSRFTPRTVAAVLGIGLFGIGAGFAVAGCGGDDNDVDSINNRIDSIQSQASSAASSVQSQAKSVSSQIDTAIQSVQSQAESVSTEIQQNKDDYGY